MLLFRIRPRLRPKAVRNVVPSFGRQALARCKLARANLLSTRTQRSTISAVDTSTRLLLLASLPQERLRVSGAHSPRARWAGRRSSRLYARRLIFSRTLACRHQLPAVPSFDLGSCPSFESSITINGSILVLLVITVFCSVLLRRWFGLRWSGGSQFFNCSHLALTSLLVNGVCVRLGFLYPPPPVVPSCTLFCPLWFPCHVPHFLAGVLRVVGFFLSCNRPRSSLCITTLPSWKWMSCSE